MLRQLLYNLSINGSVAAQREHLREFRNEGIAGVPVVFGMPKGVNASSSVGDTRLLVYLHGGGECAAWLAGSKACCLQIGLRSWDTSCVWQVNASR